MLRVSSCVALLGATLHLGSARRRADLSSAARARRPPELRRQLDQRHYHFFAKAAALHVAGHSAWRSCGADGRASAGRAPAHRRRARREQAADRFRLERRPRLQRILDRPRHEVRAREGRIPHVVDRGSRRRTDPVPGRRARADGRGARELRRAGGAAARRALHREQQQRRSADAELSLQQQLRVRANRPVRW